MSVKEDFRLTSVKDEPLRKALIRYNKDVPKLFESIVNSGNNVDPDLWLGIISSTSKKINFALDEIGDELLNLQETASTADDALITKLGLHADKLKSIKVKLDKITANFGKTSQTALRIGDRLSAAESERKRIERAQELLNYIKELQDTSPSLFKKIELLEGKELHDSLPCDLRQRSWAEIANVLHNLNRILGEISTEDCAVAQRNVLLLSDIVEGELLSQFERTVTAVITSPEDEGMVASARALAKTLLLFTPAGAEAGDHLQRKYIYDVVQKRVTVAVGDGEDVEEMQGSRRGSVVTNDLAYEDRDDHLSHLFGGIGRLCLEQSKVIALVFPPEIVDRLSRLLVGRIFHDPTFGLETKIEKVLRPKPPRQPLSPADYLESLGVVREKLSALETMLADSFGSMKVSDGNHEESAQLGSSDRSYQSHGQFRTYLEQQVSELFHPYQQDYFVREMTHLKTGFTSSFVAALSDQSLIHKSTTGAGLPKLRSDKVKSIQQLSKPGGLCTRAFMAAAVTLAEESVSRMLVVARDDKKTPLKVKDVYMLLLSFLSDSVLIPCAVACNILLCKISSASLSNGYNTTTTVPGDYVKAIGAIYDGIGRLKNSFEMVFSKPISTVPNAYVVCKDVRRKAMRIVREAVNTAVRAWIWAGVYQLEAMLHSGQSKTDYRPKIASGSVVRSPPQGPSETCLAVSKAIRRLLEEAVLDLGVADLGEVVWKPFLELFIGALIAHIRRQQISPDGAFLLLLDLDEYRKAFDGPPPPHSDCAGARDLIISLREAMYIYMVPAHDVVRVVAEDLRHLDAAVVVALLCAREDFRDDIKQGGVHWARQLALSFPHLLITGPLPWEGQAQSTGSLPFLPHGPASLRQGRVGDSAETRDYAAESHSKDSSLLFSNAFSTEEKANGGGAELDGEDSDDFDSSDEDLAENEQPTRKTKMKSAKLGGAASSVDVRSGVGDGGSRGVSSGSDISPETIPSAPAASPTTSYSSGFRNSSKNVLRAVSSRSATTASLLNLQRTTR